MGLDAFHTAAVVMPPKPKPAEVIAAASECDKKKLQSQLEAGGSADAVDKTGNSALHCIAMNGDNAAALACIKLLLEKGADVTTENDLGENPLVFAQKKKCNKIATALEEAVAVAEAAEVERKRAKAAARKAARAAKEGSESGSLPYRRTANVGWKPLLKDWMEHVNRRVSQAHSCFLEPSVAC